MRLEELRSLQEAGLLFAGCTNDLEKILAAFTFVRDELPHSGDIHSSRVTRTASEACASGKESAMQSPCCWRPCCVARESR